MPSVSTAAFDGHPIALALEVLAGLGVAAVEPAFISGYVDFTEDDFASAAARPLAARIAAAGLTVPAVSAHMDLSLPDAAAMLDRRIGFAAELGARVLITNAGPAVAEDLIQATIAAAIPRLEAAGVRLALENPGHGSGDLIGRAADGARLARAFDHPAVRLNLDLGNILTYSRGTADPADAMRTALPHVASVHLKDVASDGQGGWTFVPLGDGLIDWRPVAAILADAPIVTGVELPLRLSRPGGADPVRAPAPWPIDTISAAIRRSLAAWEEARTSASTRE